ncbi:MAG: hypothetical protein SGPRY_013633 [Prymnesium sp.]
MLAPSTAALFITATVVGGASTTPAVVGATRSWYNRIPLPSCTPPNRVFAPVWTLLFALLGAATALVADLAGGRSLAVLHFAAHFAVNLTWAPVFFGLQRLRLGNAINFVLLSSLVILTCQYAAISPPAALLLLPYMAWLMFATYLNVAICRLNPTIGGYNNARWQADLTVLQRRASAIAFG